MNSDGIWLWVLAILPGLLHPLLLFIYFRKYRERTGLISRLLAKTVGFASHHGARTASIQQKEEWRDHPGLDLATYVFPVLITSIITIAAVATMLRINDSINSMGFPPSLSVLIALTTPATVAGFAGAFVWGLYDFVDRFRTLSLPPSSLHMLWFRLILGAVLGAYSQQFFSKDFAPVFVFALAAVPVPAVLKWLQDTANQRFSLGITAAGAAPRWELVQGLTPDIISRLNEVGVTSIAHLGNQQPVELIRKTNIEWRNILDMMDQAYLAIYVDSKIEGLRLKGIRGSIEMAVLWQRVRSTDAQIKADADKVVTGVAAALGIAEADVKNMAQNLWEDPQVGRIWALWWNSDDTDGGRVTGVVPSREPGQAEAA